MVFTYVLASPLVAGAVSMRMSPGAGCASPPHDGAPGPPPTGHVGPRMTRPSAPVTGGRRTTTAGAGAAEPEPSTTDGEPPPSNCAITRVAHGARNDSLRVAPVAPTLKPMCRPLRCAHDL